MSLYSGPSVLFFFFLFSKKKRRRKTGPGYSLTHPPEASGTFQPLSWAQENFPTEIKIQVQGYGKFSRGPK